MMNFAFAFGFIVSVAGCYCPPPCYYPCHVAAPRNMKTGQAYMTSRNGSSELVQVGAVFTISPADMLDDHMPMSSEWVATCAKDSGSVYLGCFPEQTPQQSAMSWSGLHTAITVPHTVRLADS